MNLNYDIATVSRVVNGDILGGENSNSTIKTVFTDSRLFFDANTSLFIALKGPYHNGHDYIEQLYQKGVRYFIVNANENFKRFQDACYIEVKNTLKALQDLAAFHRKQFNLPVIAITGSNGKTIIKEWLYIYLRKYFNIVRSPKSYNSQVGVPLSVLQINNRHTLGIFEAGISQPKEMERLETILKPDFGIISKIGTAHLENFSNVAELENEKLKLFCESKWHHDYRNNFNPIISPQGDRFIITSTEIKHSYTTIHIIYNGTSLTCQLPFTDKASTENACTCICFLVKMGIPIEHIVEQTAHLKPIAFRLETQTGIKNNIIIRDNYNSDLTSLTIALDYTLRFKQKKSIVVLTDMLQDRISPGELYTEIATLVNRRKIDLFIGIGTNIYSHKTLFNNGIFFKNVEEFITQYDIKQEHNACILLKGSPEFRLEKINALLVKQTHQTTLKINLTALLDNIKHYSGKLSKNTGLMCMVKAGGYGMGSREISTILQYSNIDYLGVAYTDEGVELRKQGIDTSILVMNAEQSSYNDVISYRLEPSIYSYNQLEQFIRFLIDKKIKSYPIHLKLDTGMHRLGFLPGEIKDLIGLLINQPEVYVKGIFSHLAVADEPEEDDFTRKQIELFKKLYNEIESNIGYKTTKHLLNSSGIERFSEAQFDMVRLGIGMYGIPQHYGTKTVSSLLTKISQIKQINKGDTVGYGRTFKATKPMRIGIIPIGYADGFFRCLSNGKGHVWINGKTVPTLGRISMDMTTIDLSSVPDAKEGDTVEIFGKNRNIEELAKEMNTIPYEVLTALSNRVVRTYVEE